MVRCALNNRWLEEQNVKCQKERDGPQPSEARWTNTIFPNLSQMDTDGRKRFGAEEGNDVLDVDFGMRARRPRHGCTVGMGGGMRMTVDDG